MAPESTPDDPETEGITDDPETEGIIDDDEDVIDDKEGGP